MKSLIKSSVFCLAVFCLREADAQQHNVQALNATNALTAPVVIPSGQTFNIASGATLSVTSGATVTGLQTPLVSGTDYLSPAAIAAAYQPLSTATTTELGYVHNVTSSIQTQLNAKLSANQTITLSGDFSGSGATAITGTLANVNSNVGSFTNASVTVNAKGLVTAASSGAAAIGGSTGSTDRAILIANGTGGSTVQASGVIVSSANDIIAAGSLIFTGTAGTTPTHTGFNSLGNNDLSVYTGGNRAFAFSSNQLVFLGTSPQLQLSSDTAPGLLIGQNLDVTLTRGGAGVLQLGFNSATPAAYVITGNNGSGTNIAGGSLTLKGGNGTGTGGGGAIYLSTAPVGSSSSSADTMTVRMTIKATGVVNIANIPTSSSGLVSGDLYSNAGILTIVP